MPDSCRYRSDASSVRSIPQSGPGTLWRAPQIRWAGKHDDVIKWKHFQRYWPFVRGIRRSPVDTPPQGPVTRSFEFFFDLRLNKRLSNRDAGDLRHHGAHYDVIVMGGGNDDNKAVFFTVSLNPFH